MSLTVLSVRRNQDLPVLARNVETCHHNGDLVTPWPIRDLRSFHVNDTMHRLIFQTGLISDLAAGGM